MSYYTTLVTSCQVSLINLFRHRNYSLISSFNALDGNVGYLLPMRFNLEYINNYIYIRASLIVLSL